MSNEAIKVLIVDDHAMVRNGLSTFLTVFDDLELVGESSSGEEAIRNCRTLNPNVVLMDMVMPGMDGATATRHIREECPNTQVIVLTSFKEDDLVQGALEAGAIGYLLKNVGADELAAAIRRAHEGSPTLAPEAAQVLMHAATRKEENANFGLTDREREILRAMVQGRSNPEIADQLVVSRSTVKFHVSNILMKLGVGSRTEAVALALQRGLVE